MRSTETILAENHCTISRSLFFEAMRATENTVYKKTVQRIAIILTALFLTAGGYLLYTGGSLIFLLGEFIFLAALMFWMSVMLPGTRRRSKYRAMCRDTSAPPQRITRFYQDCMVIRSNTGKETTISYANVLGWQQTKHLWILNCTDNTGVLLEKSGFVIGDFGKVKSLLPPLSIN